MAAARLLDQQMREIRGANRMAAIDRVAVLAALNFALELELLRDARKGHDREIAATIGDLQRKLDSLLGS
jgi:cell division protein ZapA